VASFLHFPPSLIGHQGVPLLARPRNEAETKVSRDRKNLPSFQSHRSLHHRVPSLVVKPFYYRSRISSSRSRSFHVVRSFYRLSPSLIFHITYPLRFYLNAAHPFFWSPHFILTDRAWVDPRLSFVPIPAIPSSLESWTTLNDRLCLCLRPTPNVASRLWRRRIYDARFDDITTLA